jgi:hypothetical protein
MLRGLGTAILHDLYNTVRIEQECFDDLALGREEKRIMRDTIN